MSKHWIGRLGIVVAACASLSIGCAEEREPIVRVQADALEKSFFVGKLGDPSDDPQFYWRNFVVDGSEGQSMVGIGSWSHIDKIRWEITENLLIGRKSYEVAPGADNKGPVDNDPANGTVVAAYMITSHFDIKRAYNPSTGEELNVVEENTSDRVWNERAYMRVNWSINLVESPLWFDMFLGKIWGDVKVTPLAYYVNDRTHPDAPHFDAKQGYFDVTSKFYVEPEMMHIWGLHFPTCAIAGLYAGAAVNACDAQEAVIRSSYWRADMIPGNADFEPFVNTSASLDIIGNPGGLGSSFSAGIVTPPRVDWDPQYGYTDANMRRYMHHHPIWRQSHVLTGSCAGDEDCTGGGACLPIPDEMGKPTAARACTVGCTWPDSQNKEFPVDSDPADGTEDQCASVTGSESVGQVAGTIVGGSQCSERGWCTLPYRNRIVKTVGYWMNAETPSDLMDPITGVPGAEQRAGVGPTEDLMESWNQLMSYAVAKAREVECRRTGSGDRAGCNDLYFEPEDAGSEMVQFGGWGIQKIKPLEDAVLVACHNPVRAYDHKVCGDVGYSARVGDLRHNFLFYWPHASRAPWGGIGNWNADPQTGMIIGASATTMGRSATYAAAMNRDIIMVANGELSMSDIVEGETAMLFERKLTDGHAPETFTQEQIDSRIQSINAKHAAAVVGPAFVPGTSTMDKDFRFLGQKLSKTTVAGVGPWAPGAQNLEYDAVAAKVRGSEYEAQMIDPSWVTDVAGKGPLEANAYELIDMVSPLRGMDFARTEALNQLIGLRMQARGVCFTDIYAGNVGNLDVQGVAGFFAQKYADLDMKARGDAIYKDLWKETYKGIQLHEVGHSLGMLHNFSSSYDAVNFNPQYWQLRTNDGQSSAPCARQPRQDGNECMGPRYLDPETPDEMGRGGESRPGINYFGHTSTMEYQNERFFETVGLGSFDLHTMGALYGRVLQTIDPEIIPVDQQEPFSYRNWTQRSEQNLTYFPTGSPGYVSNDPKTIDMSPRFRTHYTQHARDLKVFDPARCRDASEAEKQHAEWRIVHGKVCMHPRKDYAAWQDFEHGVPGSAPNWMRTGNDFTKFRVSDAAADTLPINAVRWPYRWGSTFNAYIHTQASDAGADVYEVVREAIRKFEYSYPFSYFRRNNRDWFYRSLPGATNRRFFEHMRAIHWGLASDNAWLGSIDAFAQAAADDNWHRPYVMAGTDMFEMVTRAFLMPQVGEPGGNAKNGYWKCGPSSPKRVGIGATRDMYDAECGSDSVALPSPFQIDIATGRYIDLDFAGDAWGGGSWDYQNYVNHAGYTFEKSNAARVLTDGRPVFFTISRDNYLDGRNVYINFRTDMPEAIDRLLAGVLASDFETVAPYVVQSEIGASDGYPAVRTFNLAGPNEPTRPADAMLLYPNVGYKQQLGAMLFTHIFARLGADLSLANRMRVWIKGQYGELELPADEQARFYDPDTGLTYIARQYGTEKIDGKTVERGIGARMLHSANILLAKSYEVVGGPATPVFDANGQVQLVLDANGKPIKLTTPAAQTAYSQFRSYVGLLDASVQLANMVGYGPFNGWGSIELD
jgi:hypothetical protein